MKIRKATENDLDQIEEIYNRIHEYEESGKQTIGWITGVYPVRKTATDSLDRGDLFVMEDEGKTVATAIINQIQVPDYKYASWKYDAEDSEVMVLHTLIVDPSCNRKGYGKAFVRFYEEYALANGCHELRMDTNARNKTARARIIQLNIFSPFIDHSPSPALGIPQSSGEYMVCPASYRIQVVVCCHFLI